MTKNVLIALILFISVVSIFQKTYASQYYVGDIIIPQSKNIRVGFTADVDSSNQMVLVKMDVIQQSLLDYPVTITKSNIDSVIFTMDGIIKANYYGKIYSDSISGVWVQSGHSFVLNLKKSVNHRPNRPQIPNPPYPYVEKRIVYFNNDHTIKFGATLTVPENKRDVPAVILITGSGPEDRDETLFGHKPFWVIADFLTRQGIAVLRVDDRGIGETTGDSKNATSKDYADDVQIGFDYLKSVEGINSKKIGLIGHSEGSMIAMLLANKNHEIAFIVSLAGPGVSGKELLLSQTDYGLTKNKLLNKNTRQIILDFYSSLIDTIQIYSDNKRRATQIVSLLSDWSPRQDSLTKVGLGLVYRNHNWTSSGSPFNVILSTLLTPWHCFFLSYDPATVMSSIDCPMLILNGENDRQVFCDLNMNGFKAISKNLHKSRMEFHQFPELNHFFQHSITGDVSEVFEIEETFSTDVLTVIGNWINRL